ncbi:MAG: hypothetical protein IJ475_01525 [Bacilli bacterium]|nr:hypothetical protein [Bacilli bacterium]
MKEYKLEQSIILEKEAKEYLENDFDGLIELFLKYLNDEGIEIYNEDSLKFELGTFLRIVLPKYHICFEKNIRCFVQDKETIKHEIDITIYPKEGNEHNLNDNSIKLINSKEAYAIELKFPSFKIEKENDKFVKIYNQGGNQILENLEKDMWFVGQLVDNGFKKAWSFVLVPEISKSIYQFPQKSTKEPSEIYYKFRESNNQEIENNIYDITWLEWKNKGKYYIKEGHNIAKTELEKAINKNKQM